MMDAIRIGVMTFLFQGRLVWYGFRCPLKAVTQSEVNQELERQEVEEMLDDCIKMYALKQVPSEIICIEKESITDGILELISELGIQKLVMGAGSNSRFLRIKPKPTSEQSNEVLNKAPDFCHIWFVYKGRLIYTRYILLAKVNQYMFILLVTWCYFKLIIIVSTSFISLKLINLCGIRNY
ncbi:U-box domain-containing protein 33-like [Spinacia oleracea]|uniref:RING-type E3 ubiquitin transferase n=1 Tax=Spinacia oleracea TaxID=3562 RepID=A0ABM3QHY0_SPIOL|nr:U-box domain-containing protein 33-like [Spinacia oleracea]XP_056683662.1 U-box domain-containing protein 33-like [Spinacia oleracea]